MLREHFDRILSEKPPPETITELLSRARLNKGISQAEISGIIGVSPSTWSRLERYGELRMSKDRVIHACEVLDADPYQAFFLLGVMHPLMEEKILGDWGLCSALRDALEL